MSNHSPEVIALAEKLLAKKEKENAKRRDRIAEKYPFAQAETVEYDEVAKKYVVVVTCVKCGNEHSRYTQDLAQTKGICPECKKEADAEKRSEKNALVKKAMDLIRNGDVN